MNRTLRHIFAAALVAVLPAAGHAQGWPANYGGVMLQGFYWDSFGDTKWTKLEQQADELAESFDLVWIPQSGYCGSGNQMGYAPLYYFDQNSSFGTEGELRRLIAALRERGTGVIADVVVNHRANLSNWVDFPAETYAGQTYQMLSTDICRNDDGGATLSWATANGYALSSYSDSGEGWDGMRDLDHRSANVNRCVKAYLGFLLGDLGYAGFRYDMVKGYSASFTADYNLSAQPTYSVGECWDNSNVIKSWINGTRTGGQPQSAAFDFQFRYRVRDAINQRNWSQLSSAYATGGNRPLIYDEDYQRYAVTFVENHDTERRSNAEQDPLKNDTLAANAYMLAMPGTPCVFLKHWQALKYPIKRMIAARRLAGINNQSGVEQLVSLQPYHAVRTTGTRGQIICLVGHNFAAYTAPAGYTAILDGKNFRYYLSDSLLGEWDAIAERIDQQEADEQSAHDDFTPHTATIYVRDEMGWSRMNYYIWDSNNNSQLNGGWPGRQITDTQEVNGHTWYCQTFSIASPGYYVNVVFSTASGSPQTVDVVEVDHDRFFVIKNAQAGGKYIVEEDVETLPVAAVEADSPRAKAVYDLSGRLVRQSAPLRPGIYVGGGRKILIK